MAALPSFLLRDSVTVEPLVGPGATYGPSVTVRGHVQEGRKLTRNQTDGTTAEAVINVFLRVGPTLPVGSRITIRGTRLTAVTVDVNDGRGLPTPDHLDVWCELAEFVPTASLTLTRLGVSTDALGDETATTVLAVAGLPAHVLETKQDRPGPENARTTVVETYTIRLRPGTDIREDDRLTDTASGAVYEVRSVNVDPGELYPGCDVRVVARRIVPHSTT